MPGVSDISGTARHTWLTEAGENKDVPAPWLVVRAVYEKPDKTFGRIDGDYDAATGNFVIEAVPDGPYLLGVIGSNLHAQEEFLAMTTRLDLDLGEIRAGRPDAVPIVKTPTTLTLDLTGLLPWGVCDTLEMFSLGAGQRGDMIGMSVTSTKPAIGVTSLTGMTLNMAQILPVRLIDGAKGDEVVLTHRSCIGNSATVTQALTLPPITLQDGKSIKSGGAFVDVPQHNVSVDFVVSAFMGLVAEAGPGVTPSYSALSAYAEPAGDERSSGPRGPTLSILTNLGSNDQVADFSHGNPFPITYGVIGRAVVSYRLTENLPAFESLDGAIVVQGPIATLFDGPVVPGMSPPTSVTIDGKPATSDLTGVGETPVIAWKAPTLGKPTSYAVTIVSFTDVGNVFRARLTTREPSVRVPPAMLEKGGRYAAIITASTEVGVVEAPYRFSPTFASADALTPLFTP